MTVDSTAETRIGLTSREAIRLNIGVIGPPNSGKSTFLNTLLQGLFIPGQGIVTEDRYVTTGECETTTEISCMGTVIMHPNTRDEVLLCLFDTPGHGDEATPTEKDYIISDLSARMDKYTTSRSDPKLFDDFEYRMSDERIHVCIYFLPPHKMNKADLDHIRRLAPYVPIVVVIAKADTMTTDERNRYLTEVASKIKALNKELLKTSGVRAIFNLFGGDDDKTLFDAFTFASKSDLLPETAAANRETELRRRPRGFKVELSRGKDLEGGSDIECEFDDEDVTTTKDVSAAPAPTIVDSPCDGSSTHGIAGDISREEEELEHNPSDIIVYPSMDDCTTATDNTTNTKDINIENDSQLLRFKNIFPIVVHPSGCRKYKWGDCYVNDTEHSDFSILRKLMFDRVNMLRLIAATAARTTTYVENKNNKLLDEDADMEKVVECVVPRDYRSAWLVLAIVVISVLMVLNVWVKYTGGQAN